MTTYAIGDIQGCLLSLEKLLEKMPSVSSPGDACASAGRPGEAAPGEAGDNGSAGAVDTACRLPRLVFVGDLVNRGPLSLATLRRIRAMGDSARVVLGNHDLHLLAVSQGLRKMHKSDTLQEILDAPDREELLTWLRHRPLAIFDDGHLFVHGGVPPQWTASQTVALSAEVEAALQGPDWVARLAGMFGNEPALWRDDLAGDERLRAIVNGLTRIRYCFADGALDFATKETGDTVPVGLTPWFDMPGRRTSDVTVVFGHWASLGLMMRPALLGLDTGCVWGNKLTAVNLADRSVLQVEAQEFIQFQSKNYTSLK
jgi:bis(5'-nucleosyl)-tetraphosphatase (symmetrical)